MNFSLHGIIYIERHFLQTETLLPGRKEMFLNGSNFAAKTNVFSLATLE